MNRGSGRVGPVAVSTFPLLAFLMPVSVVAQALPLDTPTTGTYEYRYPHNTADLVENHYIVLDTSSGELRGWYYGTSDDFDAGREGYRPGFFVAQMEALHVGEGRITFELATPTVLFTTPVPLHQRADPAAAGGTLTRWTFPLTGARRRYAGAYDGHSIILNVDGGARVFERLPPRGAQRATRPPALSITADGPARLADARTGPS